jgi:calcineurin-like phosphoesterase family protein
MNGTKVLVCGNHDKGANAMKTAGFDVVLYGASLVIANELVTMSHCPLIGVFREDVTDMKGSAPGELWHGETRHSRYYSTVDRGQYHLHGHIHSPNGGKSVKILDKQYDVGVVANNYRPVSISDIESWISLHKQGKV